MKTGAKGSLAVLKVLERCLEKDIIASLPAIEARYDVVLDIDGKLWRAQVKYGDRKGRSTGSISVPVESFNVAQGRRKYTTTEVDVILAYLPVTGKIYWLPSRVWEGKATVYLRFAAAKNNQTVGCLDVKDFEW